MIVQPINARSTRPLDVAVMRSLRPIHTAGDILTFDGEEWAAFVMRWKRSRCWNCGGDHHPNDCPEPPRVDPKLNADGTAGCGCAE